MIFLTYEFLVFVPVIFLVYYAFPWTGFRKFWIIASGYAFLFLYGGLTSVAVASVVLVIAYGAGRLNSRSATLLGILACAGVLIFYKYTGFILENIPTFLLPSTPGAAAPGLQGLAPAVIPLGISFFAFEFIHYLVEVRRGRPPIRSFSDFLCFGLFWPTMVAGPIKRYGQFIPALHHGLAQPRLEDVASGLGRIAVGLAKKWAADNLTGWIIWFEPHFDTADPAMRWVFLLGLSARILLDFSGYSDIAIGFARLFGIIVPENFNWPYLARSPAEFWQRWHMSLSSWIRDYIYIPLGGNRLGTPRRIVNGLTAMALCGLWHGPHWNFAVWGLYHGIGLAAGSLASRRAEGSARAMPANRPWTAPLLGLGRQLLSWGGTMLFVALGWLLFFYPVERAVHMAAELIPIFGPEVVSVSSGPGIGPAVPNNRGPAPTPAGVAGFPDGLLAPGLFFAGVTQDGWLRDKAQARFALPGTSTQLHLVGEIPAFSPKITGGAMRITVDGTLVLERPETSGRFDLTIPIPPAVGVRRINFDITGTDLLPAPDGRLVSVHLTSIMLESNPTGAPQ
jgi:alginate O-acetyltransferase complex protein AlgI